MAKKQDNAKGGSSMVIVLFAILGMLAIWSLVTPEYLLKTLGTEREFAMQMGGVNSDRWIYTQSLSSSTNLIKDATGAIKDLGNLPDFLKTWAQGRVIVTWLWYSLITYRGNLLLMYFFVLFPFMLAIMADGWGVREISMHRFSAQSPMKHRFGVVLSNFTLFCATIWILVPVAVPSLVAPATIIAVGIAGRIWLANLQKRI